MSGFNTPSQVSVDPTPASLQPLQQALAQRMMNTLQQGYSPSPSFFPGMTSPLTQLYGAQPGTGTGLPPGPTVLPPGGPTGGGGLDGSDFLSSYPISAFNTPGADTRGVFGVGGGGFGPQPLAEPSLLPSGSRYNFTPSYLNQQMPTSQNVGDMFAFSPTSAFDPSVGTPIGGQDPTGNDTPVTQGPGGGYTETPQTPQGGTAPVTGPGATGGSAIDVMLAGQGTDRGFNLPMFGGPYAAPLTSGQLDALSGFQQMFNPQQIVTTSQMGEAVQQGISGNQIFNPGQGNLSDVVAPYDTRSSTQGNIIDQIIGGSQNAFGGLPSNFMPSFESALNAPQADTSGIFQAGEEAFQGDLDEIIARTREEASAFGLNPGSTDRTGAQIRDAGRAAANFRLGQEQLGMQSFENAEGRRLGALNIAPQVAAASNISNSNLLNLLPSLMQGDQTAFSNFFNIANPAAQRASSALNMLPTFSNLPFQQAQGLFDINEQARGVGDSQITRLMNEFARTQGGGLNQMLGLFGNSFPMSTGFGPSPMSSLSQLGGGIASLFGD